MKLQKIYFLITAICIIIVTFLHYLGPGPESLHEFYRELYYFPIFVSAFGFGLRGAMITAVVIEALYFPYILNTWKGTLAAEAGRLTEAFFYLIFAIAAGYIVEQGRKLREQVERDRFVTSLGFIMSGIVHDLKNPLTAIIGLLERLVKGKGDPQKYLPLILNESHKMERIVYDVLDFARPIKLKKESANLADIVSQAIETCGEKTKTAQVTLESQFIDIIKEVDPFLIERALVNLISNAIEASKPTQAVKVILMQEKSKAIILIQDEGIGMDAKTLKRCFEPLYTSKTGGTGLGLAITKKVIDAHEGKINIKTAPGKGTQFQIILD